jgi:hypothetical protein
MVARLVRFYSEHDESAFFQWLDKIPCITRYRGEGDAVYIDVVRSKVDDSSLREMLALFYRYGVDMQQLAVFECAANRGWFSDPKSYWFDKLYEQGKGARLDPPQEPLT